MFAEKLHNRGAENLTDDIGHKGSAAVTGSEKASIFKSFERIAQDRARYIELSRKLAFGKKLSRPCRLLPPSWLQIIPKPSGGQRVSTVGK
jgi:hypothetical protein